MAGSSGGRRHERVRQQPSPVVAQVSVRPRPALARRSGPSFVIDPADPPTSTGPTRDPPARFQQLREPLRPPATASVDNSRTRGRLGTDPAGTPPLRPTRAPPARRKFHFRHILLRRRQQGEQAERADSLIDEMTCFLTFDQPEHAVTSEMPHPQPLVQAFAKRQRSSAAGAAADPPSANRGRVPDRQICQPLLREGTGENRS
jgi:hypothetical protein